MKEKVIFDTNIIRNTGANGFLGGRDILGSFLQDADIVIPEIVIQEIKRQKKKTLESDRDEFLNNPLHTILDVNKATTKDFNVENYIQKLLKEEAIPFEVIDLKNNDVLPKITDLALDKKPPFEGNGGDKGFKDALIYFSVLEYLQKTPNKKVFVCVKDKRLKKAFNKHHNIIVVEGYEEFKEQSISQFFDDYFIEKVNEEIIEVDITKEHIVEFWNNINEKKIVLIKIEDTEYVIEVESNEIISTSSPELYKTNIEYLINARSFATTHSAIKELTPFIKYFSDEDILNILNASFSNEQIKWIIKDEDVKEFIGTLYKAKSELVKDDVAEFLKEIFK
jgi:rRNA-processing protein FCF1